MTKVPLFRIAPLWLLEGRTERSETDILAKVFFSRARIAQRMDLQQL
jgi:hypothetical protein